MNTPIQPPSKIHVTGVTRVTTAYNLLNLLIFSLVTRLSSLPYTPCNAAQRCNAKANPYLLRADLLRKRPLSVCRWIRLQNTGRGIEPNAMDQSLCPRT